MNKQAFLQGKIRPEAAMPRILPKICQFCVHSGI